MVRVTAQGSKRVSLAALIATRPGAAGTARLIYRTHTGRGHRAGRRKGFAEADYPRLPAPRTSNSAARSWSSGTT